MSKENSVVKFNIDKISYAITLLVIGILFCFNLASRTVSLVAGIVLILLGVVNLLSFVLGHLSMINSSLFSNAFVITLGIYFIIKDIVSIVIDYVPYLMIVVGAIIIIDAILGKVMRKENSNLMKFIIILLIGIIILTVGLLIVFVPEIHSRVNLFIGIVLIVYSIYLLVNMAVKSRSKK